MFVQKLSGFTDIYIFLAAYMIRGARTKFVDEGLAITFTFFRITRQIFQFGTCQFNIIARNEKLSSGKILVRGVLIQVRYSRLSFFLANHGHHTTVHGIQKKLVYFGRDYWTLLFSSKKKHHIARKRCELIKATVHIACLLYEPPMQAWLRLKVGSLKAIVDDDCKFSKWRSWH